MSVADADPGFAISLLDRNGHILVAAVVVVIGLPISDGCAC